MTRLSVMCYRYDCGILALKFMEFLNGVTLSTLLVEVKLVYTIICTAYLFILSHNMKSVISIYVGQDAHVQVLASCAIIAQ